MYNLQEEVQQAKRYAAQYCEGLLGLFQKGESLLVQDYAQAGSPYGNSESAMWKWHSERYFTWKVQQAMESGAVNTLERDVRGLETLGEAKYVTLADERQAMILTTRGLLRLHLTTCVQLMDALDVEARQMTQQEKEGILFQLATSYVMLKIA